MGAALTTLSALYATSHREGWRARAACRAANPAVLDPTTATPTSRYYAVERADRERAARVYCQGCVSLRPCAEEADDHLDVGVRGGSLRHLDANTHDYTVDPLIPEAPPTRIARRAGVKPRHPKRVAS